MTKEPFQQKRNVYYQEMAFYMIVLVFFCFRFNSNLPQNGAKTVKNALPDVGGDAKECNIGLKCAFAGEWCLQRKSAAAVEFYQAGLEEVFVCGLDRVRAGFEHLGAGFVEFRNGGFAVLVFYADQLKGVGGS